MNLILPLAFGEMKASGTEFRGFSKNILLKPILYFFQYFFGYHLTPNESFFVAFVFIILLISISIGLLRIFKSDKSNFWFVTLCGLFPYFAIYGLLEPLTLPGSTQFESKHATFVIPFILFILTFLRKTKPILKYIFQFIFLASLSIGLYYSFSNPYPNWSKVKSMANTSQNVIADGPASHSVALYLEKKSVNTCWDTSYVGKTARDSNHISLILDDYKSYQILTKEQMWNTGTGSDDRNAVATYTLQTLYRNGFKAIESYSHYPLFCYRFIKTNTIQPIPWFYSFAYADLHLPVTIKNDTILGWFPYQSGDTIKLSKSFYYMIESTGAEKITFELIKSDNTSSQLTSKTEADKFRSHRCIAITGYDKKVKEWHKRPLLSSSLAYPGSYLPGTGYIYQFNPKTGDKALVVRGKDVKVWFGVEK